LSPAPTIKGLAIVSTARGFGKPMSMTLTQTLVLLGVSLAVGALARWRSARPVEPGKVRMMPWTLILVVCGVLVVFAAGNLMAIWGVSPPPMR
jgi:uncharacterized membrane protein YidH (DUF202 family)